MHEYGLMEAVVARALEACGNDAGARPVRLHVQVGEFAFASQESLETAFEVLTRGTPLEGAQLDIERVPGRASCEACGFSGSARDLGPDLGDPPVPLICPRCGYLLLVAGGTGVVLADIQLQDRGTPEPGEAAQEGR